MTITINLSAAETVRIGEAIHRGEHYEVADILAHHAQVNLLHALDELAVARWTAEHWAADDRPMPELLVDIEELMA